MKQFLLLVGYCFLFASFKVYADCDTNQVNVLNDRTLEMAYDHPKQALVLIEQTISKSRTCHFPVGEIRALIRRGICYDVMSKPHLAIAAYNESLQISKKEKYRKGIASNQNNLGLIYWKIGKIKNALFCFQQALRSFEQLEDWYNMGVVCNNLGLIEEELNREKMALPWYRKSLTYYQKAQDEAAKLDVYSNVANAYLSMSQYDSSAYYSRKAIEGYRKNGNTYGLAISLNNLALVYIRHQDLEVSNQFLIESAQLAKALDNQFSYISSRYNYADNLVKMKRYREAIAILEELYPMAQRIDFKELLTKISFQMGIVYLHLGENERAAELFKKYQVYHLEYNNEVLDKDVTRMQVLYDIQSEKQRAQLYRKKADAELEAQRSRRKLENSIWISILFVFVLSGLLVVFIQRKRRLQKELEAQKAVFEATNEERKRISYDLHDMVGSQLSYVVNNLELLNYSDPSNDRVQKTFHMSQAAMGSLRDTVWALHSEEITVHVLISRLQNVSKRWLEDSGINVRYDMQVEHQVQLDASQTLHIMRIYQEAVANIIKHAQASEVLISLKEREGSFYLVIADNGKGIEGLTEKEFHYGLKSMQERAAKIQAQLYIEQNEPTGVKIKLSW